MNGASQPADLAVVTGGAGALGRAVVTDLVERGWTVAVLDRPGEPLDEVAHRPGVHAVPADLADRAAVQEAFTRVDELGRPSALVALAGGFRPGPLADLYDDLLTEMWQSNVAALLWSCQQAAARMAPGGAIVTVGSRTAVSGPGPVAYGAAKAAVVRATELLADELRPRGIRVNCVLPSVIDTPANRSWMAPGLADRAVAPEAIAAVVAFLLGPDSAAVSGARIPVYGDA